MSSPIPARRLIKPEADAAADAAAQAEFNEKKWVWVPDETHGYLPGWIISETILEPGTLTRGSKTTQEKGDYNQKEDGGLPSRSLEDAALVGETLAEVVLADGGETRTMPSYELSKMNPPKFDRVEDIADLTFLNEASVAHNLRLRYGSGLIYTYSGLFLISINPYQNLPLYTPQIVASYRGRRRDDCAPHIFATAERAWVQMIEESTCQSVLITGESGAGKTENTKKVIQYLAAIASPYHTPEKEDTRNLAADITPPALLRPLSFRGKDALRKIQKDAEHTGTLEKQILQANPILEAFGNAQTLRNNNSSRFGKFIRILFQSDGTISGANVDWYLLEKSRVTDRNAGERNFHVFYQLLSSGNKGKEIRDKLLLSENPHDYGFLKQSRTQIDGVDDSSEWQLLRSAFRTVGFSYEEQFDIFRVLAAILHIGNIALRQDRAEQASITSPAEAEKVCHLLGISAQEFTNAVLRPTVKAGREVVIQARTKAQAEDELAALCKTLYEKMFGVIVDRINKALDRPASNSRFIGVLDIAGFEIFDVNGYEQLMINFTNERLQQFFNHHMFVLEQEEYGRERIDWQVVNFGLDLQPTIELIGSMQPMGILATLDDACIMPKATDLTFLQRVKQDWIQPESKQAAHSGSSNLEATRFSNGFIVKHYAGRVEYNTDGWLQKNKDPINDSVAGLLSRSTVPAIGNLFSDYAESAQGQGAVTGAKRVKRGVFRTTSQRHREQLDSLIRQLRATQPHFVRCIVPNSSKKPRQMDVPLVLDQLRCNGVLEGIRIARLGYPNRLPFTEFRNRYEVLAPGVVPPGFMDGRKASVKIVEALALFPESYKMGLTKIFFKAGVLAELEERRDGHLYDIFARFQSIARKHVAHRKMKKYLNRANAVQTIQRNARAYNELRDWPWWQLFTQVKPLLGETREDEEMAKRKQELALAKERAELEKVANAKLEEERLKLETEKKAMMNDLETIKLSLEQRDQVVQSCRQRESDQQEEIKALKDDIDLLEEQLEQTQSQNMTLRARYDALILEHKAHLDKDKSNEEQQKMWQDTISDLSTGLTEARLKVAVLEEARDAALAGKQELERTLQRLREDVGRLKEKTLAAEQAAESKVVEERSKNRQAGLRIQTLESELKARDQRLSTLSATTEDYQVMIKKKTADLAELRSQLAAAQAEGSTLRRQLASQASQLEDSGSRLIKANAEQERARATLARTEKELDSLRTLMAARRSEEVQRAEAESSREKELLALRDQMTMLSQNNATELDNANKAVKDLEAKLIVATTELRAIKAAKTESEANLKVLSHKLESQQALLRSAEAVKRGLESDLAETRNRLIEQQATLAEVTTTRDSLEKQLRLAERKLADHEDALLATERQKADWARKLDVTSRELKGERDKAIRLETLTQQSQAQCAELREHHGKLASEAKEKDAEIALLRSRENKTIIEHVHVLEKAKKVTDRELAATKRERDELATLVKSLDQHKARLISDIEDMAKQNDILRQQVNSSRAASDETDLSAQVQAERHAKEQAQNRVHELERQLKARKDVDDLQKRLDAAERRNDNLEKELAAHVKDGSQLEQPKRFSTSPSHARLLQELQLNNEQLREQMSEELRRGQAGLVTDPKRRSMDLAKRLDAAPVVPDESFGDRHKSLKDEISRLQAKASQSEMARQSAEAGKALAEDKLRQMQKLIESTDFQSSAVKAHRSTADMEPERARYQKDLRDFEYTISQTRAKYQNELSKLSDDLAAQRADMLRYKEANRLLKAKEEELRLQLEDELHSSSGWKRDRERLESRVADLNAALEAATAETSKTQGQQVQYIEELKDLRKRLDEAELDNAALRAAKQKLEMQNSTSLDKNVRTSHLSQDRVVQQLAREKQELTASLESMNDRISLARQKQARSEAHAAECMQELNKVRQLNAEVDRRNISLENKMKALQIKLVDLETQSLANSPRPAAAKRLATTMAELQAKYDREVEEKLALLDQYRQVERTAREMRARIEEISRDKSRGASNKGPVETPEIVDTSARLRRTVNLASHS